jgi:hypothetical protein
MPCNELDTALAARCKDSPVKPIDFDQESFTDASFHRFSWPARF